MKRPRRDKKGRIMKKKEEPPEILYGFNIEITDDDDFNPYDYKVTDELADTVNIYRERCHTHPKEAVNELPAIIDRFPKVPMFKNHLFAAYRNLGKYDEAWMVNDLALKAHPDYVYVVLNKAAQYFEADDLEKVAEVLGGEPIVITRTFPKRKTFHTTELFVYFRFLIHLRLKEGNPDAAQSYLDLIKSVMPDHPEITELQEKISLFSLKSIFSDLLEFSKNPRAYRAKKKK